MKDLTSAEERFRHINPVPDPFDPPMNTETAAMSLLEIEKRQVTPPTTSTQPINTGPKRPLLIATGAAAIVILLGAALLAMLTAGRGSPDVAAEDQSGVFATSIDDVAGRWRASAFPWYLELTHDGTHAYGVDELRLEDNLTGEPDGTYRFDGNLVYLESSGCRIRDIAEPGIYRIRLLAPEMIQFEPVEETCRFRYDFFAVDSSTFEPVTWSRVKD